jgi:hypothetical protein
MIEMSALAIQVLIFIGGVLGGYVAIRADLAHLKAKLESCDANIKEAKAFAVRAHHRLDDHIEKSHIGKLQ